MSSKRPTLVKTEEPLDPRDELGDLQVVYPKLLDVDESKPLTYDTAVKPFWGKPVLIMNRCCVELELPDQGKEIKPVRFTERFGPPMPQA